MRREKKPRKCDKSFVSKFANTLLVDYKLFHFRAAKFVFTKSHRKKDPNLTLTIV